MPDIALGYRPRGTTVQAGYGISGGRPEGTTVDAGSRLSGGHPVGTVATAVRPACKLVLRGVPHWCKMELDYLAVSIAPQPSRGVWEHAPPEIFGNLDSLRAILTYFGPYSKFFIIMRTIILLTKTDSIAISVGVIQQKDQQLCQD